MKLFELSICEPKISRNHISSSHLSSITIHSLRESTAALYTEIHSQNALSFSISHQVGRRRGERFRDCAGLERILFVGSRASPVER